jgi:hypothetical protein
VFHLLVVPTLFRIWGHYSDEVGGHKNAHQIFTFYVGFEHLNLGGGRISQVNSIPDIVEEAE